MLFWKWAIFSGVMLCLAAFLLGFLLILLNLPKEIFGVIMIVIIAALTAIVTEIYFKIEPSPKIKPKDCLLFGVAVAATMFVLEVILMIYGLHKEWSYFTSWDIIVGYVLVILIPAALACANRKK